MKERLEKTYEAPEKAPWHDSTPPLELTDLIKKRILQPCRVLDIGCGAGHHSIYLVQRGFEVTGIDVSENAIAYAKKNATREGVTVDFRAVDANSLDKIEGKFDFVLEWGLLHFIPFEDRKAYVQSVANLLNPGGKYLSLSFSEKSPEWGGGKVRKGITGSTVYYSSMEEIKQLFKPHFNVLEAKERPTYFVNSGNTHIHNYLFMEKNNERTTIT